MKTELQKLNSAQSRAIIDNLITECLSFEEFQYWMQEYDCPAWFDVRKCWNEEITPPQRFFRETDGVSVEVQQ